ncbi:MAG TPA: secretin and TonB N-terminal domain-containing protein [Thermoanaerobaculia bacterium]|nr:secretin and TonB N-terminal domain-containing protein [Thermoanaerobaculia bacterium]
MRSRYPALVALSLVALPALAAPAAKKPRIRVTRPPASGALPVLGYPAIAIGEGPRRYVGEPISLDLKDADIRDVLLTFSKLARLNMVIDPDVRGSVTVRLENVPWDQALEVILKVNGLGYVLEGNIVRVGVPTKL